MESYWDLLPYEIKRIIICYAFMKEGKDIWCQKILNVHEEFSNRLFCVHYSSNLLNINKLFVKNKKWHVRHSETNKCIECWT